MTTLGMAPTFRQNAIPATQYSCQLQNLQNSQESVQNKNNPIKITEPINYPMTILAHLLRLQVF